MIRKKREKRKEKERKGKKRKGKMLEFHYFLLGIVILLALVYFYNDVEIRKDMERLSGAGNGGGVGAEEFSVLVDKKNQVPGSTAACRPFKWGRLTVVDDPNLPLDKKTEFQTEAEADVDANRLGKLDDDIVSNEGGTGERGACFGKEELMFDGIWKRKCSQNGLDRDCQWEIARGGGIRAGNGVCGGNVGKYCADDFFHFPEKCMPVGGEVFTGDQCAGLVKAKDNRKECCIDREDNWSGTVIQA